jgi:hypothetical protein
VKCGRVRQNSIQRDESDKKFKKRKEYKGKTTQAKMFLGTECSGNISCSI